jgi:hypothetical protein
MAKTGTLFGKPREEVVKRPGAFTAKAKAAGKSTGAYAKQVLKPSSSASTRTKKQAALAQTFAKLRAGKAKFLVPLMLAGMLGTAGAVNVSCPNAWLVGPAPQAAAAVGPNSVTPRGSTALVVQAISPSGTATVVLEMCCSPIDCSAAGTWAPVTGGSMSLAAATPTQVLSVTSPMCTYRANVTACSGCAVNVAAACGP